MKPYLVVSGDFTQTGGMDRANLALAAHLVERGDEVHLVAHRASPVLLGHPNLILHRVPRPAGFHLLGAPLLDRAGRQWASRIAASGGTVLVNGGNCRWGDVNWVHYVHAAYQPQVTGSVLRRLKGRWTHRQSLDREGETLRGARLVITNSKSTKRHVVELLGVPADRVHTVYYGIDADQFHPPSAEQRAQARAALQWPGETPTVAFIGALSDRRKGFDTLFAAWKILCADSQWDADLCVVGAGAELSAWKARAGHAGLGSRIRFLGFRRDVSRVLAACDVLVAPTRYEAYGLGVQEALCSGLPALVSRTAGIAERYPPSLEELLIPDPEHASDLAQRLRAWRKRAPHYAAAVASLSRTLRAHTWERMASQMVTLIKTTA